MLYVYLILLLVIFREISESAIGSFASKISTSVAETDGDTGSNVIQVLTVLNSICGGNPLPTIPPKSALKSPRYYKLFKVPLVNFTKKNCDNSMLHRGNTFSRRTGIDQRSALNETESNIPELCTDLFATLQNNSQTEALYEYIHPFIRYHISVVI